jgi:hypothetical protein
MHQKIAGLSRNRVNRSGLLARQQSEQPGAIKIQTGCVAKACYYMA